MRKELCDQIINGSIEGLIEDLIVEYDLDDHELDYIFNWDISQGTEHVDEDWDIDIDESVDEEQE
jgi:hypothetical protein